jgi:hypothetical protein
MKFTIHNLREYPFQPITDFSKARNWFVENIPDNEYVLFTSDHEEIPNMLLDYIDRLEPKYPYYNIRLIYLINGRQVPLHDPTWRANLVSNKMRFVGKIHESPRPRWKGGLIDIPMIHNGNGLHSYDTWEPKWYSTRYFSILRMLVFNWRNAAWNISGRGLFRKGNRRYY